METMTLEQIYYIAEIIGAIAIIASLIYVGKQLRQNTQAIQAAARQAAVEGDNQWLIKAIDHPEMALAQTKPELTDEEVVQYIMSLILLFRNRENDFAQYQRGVMDEATWDRYRSSFTTIFRFERSRNFWVNFGQSAFDHEFFAEVNGILKELPIAQDGWANYHRALLEKQ